MARELKSAPNNVKKRTASNQNKNNKKMTIDRKKQINNKSNNIYINLECMNKYIEITNDDKVMTKLETKICKKCNQ